MAISGFYYRGKELLECELEKLTPEQRDIATLETNSKYQNELNKELSVKLAKINADYAEKNFNTLVKAFKLMFGK